MRVGIFAKTFRRTSIEENLDAVRARGLDGVQYNMACAGLASMPDAIDPALCDRVRQAAAARGIALVAVSGTFNLIHPDPDERRAGFRRLRTLAAACRRLGTGIITLCTGTRDPEDMWRRHPDNDTPGAWRELTTSMQEVLRIAADCEVTMAAEPELSNVMDTARKARRLLDDMQSPQLKIVMDAANLFHAGELGRMHDVMNEAFDLLGDAIVIAHAKDLTRDGAAGDAAAGTGVLDYAHYLALLRQADFDGPLVLHGLEEAQVPGCVAFLRTAMAGG